jgi:hypothetical protein
MPRNERNRTVARFEHNGQSYIIHERKHKLSDGSWFASRFICDSNGDWQGWAKGIKEAREVLEGKRDRHTGKMVTT